MKDDIELYEEHSGVLYSKIGKSEVVFFGHQVAVGEDEITITPNVLKFKPTPDEKALFTEYAKPLTAKLLFNKSKSVLNDLAFSDAPSEDKAKLLKELRSEINKLLRKI